MAGLRAYLLGLIFPRCCEVCGRPLTAHENIMCLHCRLDLPLTGLHRQPFNTIHERLASHPAIERATAMFQYIRTDRYVNLILNAKYRHRPNIFRELASEYAQTLLSEGFFDGIDAIQPVPMHWWKRLRRGYNQTNWLARGLSDATGLPIIDCLTVERAHSTQTRKNRLERWLNARNAYSVINDEDLTDRHILIVDDVITTGSTIKACAEKIHASSPTTRISILSLGITTAQ